MDTKAVQTPSGLSSAEAAHRLREFGSNQISEIRQSLFERLTARLWAPLPWMLEATILLEILLDHILQAILISVLLLFNAFLGVTQESKARAAVTALTQKLALSANVERDGVWQTVPADRLVPGDLVKLPLGSIVPADIRIGSGQVSVDESMLTGESLAADRSVDDVVFAGAQIRRGEATGVVVATAERTAFGKTASLVAHAEGASSEEHVVLAVVRDLALVNGAIVLGMLIYAHRIGLDVSESVPLLLTAMLASVPVALPATFTLAAALSARRLVRQSVLPTRLAAVNEAATMTVLCSDKTGTLTVNALAVSHVLGFRGYDGNKVVALAAAASSDGGDPVDRAIRDAARARGLDVPSAVAFTPFDPTTKTSTATLTDGSIVRKGAVHALADAPLSLVEGKARAQLAGDGCRILGVQHAGVLVGMIGMADPPRPDAAPLINSLERLGIRVVMVTGDAPETALTIARSVGIQGRLCDAETFPTLRAAGDYGVFAGLYPEQKLQLVQLFQKAGHVVGMCGDGVNDAPALRQAQMGIAVSTATDVAKAAAGLVLTEPGLSGIVRAIGEGRATFQRIRTYTLSMVARKILFVLYLAFGLVITRHAVLTPLLMVLLLIVNDFLTMAITTDRAQETARPNRWRVASIMAEGGAYGLSTLAFALGVLGLSLSVSQLAMRQIQTLSFVMLMLVVQAVIYVARTSGALWSAPPSGWLAAATAATVAIGLILAAAGILMPSIPLIYLLAVAVCTVVFAVFLDIGARHIPQPLIRE